MESEISLLMANQTLVNLFFSLNLALYSLLIVVLL